MSVSTSRASTPRSTFTSGPSPAGSLSAAALASAPCALLSLRSGKGTVEVNSASTTCSRSAAGSWLRTAAPEPPGASPWRASGTPDVEYFSRLSLPSRCLR